MLDEDMPSLGQLCNNPKASKKKKNGASIRQRFKWNTNSCFFTQRCFFISSVLSQFYSRPLCINPLILHTCQSNKCHMLCRPEIKLGGIDDTIQWMRKTIKNINQYKELTKIWLLICVITEIHLSFMETIILIKNNETNIVTLFKKLKAKL